MQRTISGQNEKRDLFLNFSFQNPAFALFFKYNFFITALIFLTLTLYLDDAGLVMFLIVVAGVAGRGVGCFIDFV